MKRFELLTPSSQTICATKLRYIPIENLTQSCRQRSWPELLLSQLCCRSSKASCESARSASSVRFRAELDETDNAGYCRADRAGCVLSISLTLAHRVGRVIFPISALERTRTSTPEATDPKSAAYTIPPLRLKYLLTCTFYLTMASSRRQKVKSTQSTKNQELKKVLNTILSRVYFAIFPWAIASN